MDRTLVHPEDGARACVKAAQRIRRAPRQLQSPNPILATLPTRSQSHAASTGRERESRYTAATK